MPHLDVHHLNFLAIGVAGLAAWFLGAIWYTAIFGKMWLRQHGYTVEQQNAMKAKRPMPVFLVQMLICYLIAALALAHFVPALGAQTAVGGLIVGVALWVVAECFRLTSHIASPKPWGVFFIDAGFDLVALTAMGVIIALWK